LDVQVGSGEFTYLVLDEWGKGCLLAGQSSATSVELQVDNEDRVYVFNRSETSHGRLRSLWKLSRFVGERGCFRTLMASIRTDNTIFCTITAIHTVSAVHARRKVLLEIGVPGKAFTVMSGEPFS